jgi:transcriptional regulator with XRE-family HTH domain
MTIGEKIKSIRIQKGLTQEVLAEKTSVSTRTIQRIENNEVDPRSYTLEKIAEALNIDFTEFSNFQFENIKKEDTKLLALLHLSGLFVFLFPPLLIWLWKKDQIVDLDKHAKDVINFQLSMWIYLFASMLLVFLIIGVPLLIFLGIASSIIIVLNSIKVLNKQPYKYPYSRKFLK